LRKKSGSGLNIHDYSTYFEGVSGTDGGLCNKGAETPCFPRHVFDNHYLWRYYRLRPVFQMKFGLPTVPLTSFRWLPGVKSVLSLEANDVLKLLQGCE
jgi:hypothetical protein